MLTPMMRRGFGETTQSPHRPGFPWSFRLRQLLCQRSGHQPDLVVCRGPFCGKIPGRIRRRKARQRDCRNDGPCGPDRWWLAAGFRHWHVAAAGL